MSNMQVCILNKKFLRMVVLLSDISHPLSNQTD